MFKVCQCYRFQAPQSNAIVHSEVIKSGVVGDIFLTWILKLKKQFTLQDKINWKPLRLAVILCFPPIVPPWALSRTVQAIAPLLYNNNNSVPSFQQPRTKPVGRKKKRKKGLPVVPLASGPPTQPAVACGPQNAPPQSLFLSGTSRAVCSLRQNKQE